MRSLITGSTGFIGQALIKNLDQPVVMGRSQKRMQQLFGDIPTYEWSDSVLLEQEIFQGVDTVFHLAGESVFKGRWNTAKKNRILSSRVDGTRHLVESMSRLKTPPSTQNRDKNTSTSPTCQAAFHQ